VKNTETVNCGLVLAAQDVLSQGLELLESSKQSYAQIAGSPFQSSIGQHYRHVLEHFQCLLEAAESGEVNYDARKRDRRIETEVSFAKSATCGLMEELRAWTTATLKERCTTISSVGYSSDLASTIPSNMGRELAYCIGHAIHHYAIIRLVCSQVGVDVSTSFGYAPSTIRHQNSHAAE